MDIIDNKDEVPQTTNLRGSHIKFTYEDYLLTPEGKDYELIDGELLMTPAPNWKHQEIIGNLYSLLRQFLSKKNIGKVALSPIDVTLSETNVVQPDIIFISEKNKSIIKEAYVDGAPDLMIEVLSPSSFHRDLITKRKLYGKFGVQEYWIVDPEKKSVEVINWQGSEFKTLVTYPESASFASPLLPDFTFKISEIF